MPRTQDQPRIHSNKTNPGKELTDEFDVVEEEPDQVTTTSEDEECKDDRMKVNEKKTKSDGKKPENVAKRTLLGRIGQLNSVEMRERVASIEGIKLTFKDFLSVLDYYMLGLFVKSMIAFFAVGSLLSLIFLAIVYVSDADLWYEYFPVEDDEALQLEPDFPQKFPDEL